VSYYVLSSVTYSVVTNKMCVQVFRLLNQVLEWMCKSCHAFDEKIVLSS
jgi:hypothetical protein